MCLLVEAKDYDVAVSHGTPLHGVCLCGRDALLERIKRLKQQLQINKTSCIEREYIEAQAHLEANVGVLCLWEDVRFLLEKKRHMVITNLYAFELACKSNIRYTGAVNADSCIIAQALTPGEKRPTSGFFPLSDDTDITALKNKVIVWQTYPNAKVNNKPLRNTYIPERFLSEADEEIREEMDRKIQEENMEIIHIINDTWLMPRTKTTYRFSDEMFRKRLIQEVTAHQFGFQRSEENTRRVLQCFHDYAANKDQRALTRVSDIPFDYTHRKRLTFRRGTKHPSRSIIKDRFPGFLDSLGNVVRWEDYEPLPPPPSYVCHCCANYFKPIHFCDQCPGKQRPHWIWMIHRRPPYGLFGMVKVDFDSPVEIIEAAKWCNGTDLLIEEEELHRIEEQLRHP